MGAETAAPVARAPSRRRAATRRGGAASPSGPAGHVPGGGNRARQALLGKVGPIMRSCGCGCGGACEERSVARKAAPGAAGGQSSPALGSVVSVVGQPGRSLDGRTRTSMERSFGRDFGGVRVHNDAAANTSARSLGARAYTVGDHIVFGAGQYAPDRRDGRQLIAHELTHTVQQRDGRHVQRAGTVSEPGDPHEREAEAVAAAVIAGQSVAPARSAPADTVHRDVSARDVARGLLVGAAGPLIGGALAVTGADEQIVDTGAEAVGDLYEAGKEVGGELVEGVRAAWDLAHDIAEELDAAIDVSGCGIVVTIPKVSVDESFTLDIPVPKLSLSWPLAVGVLPLTGVVNAYGMLYLNLSAIPTLSVQLGPASIDGGAILIDWCTPTYGGAVNVTYTLAAALGAQVRAGIGGEVGLEVNVPIPPVIVPVPIPLASIDAGIVGAVLGTGAATVKQRVVLAYAAGALTYKDQAHIDAGVKLSAGVGAFGSLTALGINLCTLYWPFWTKAWDTTWSVDRGLDFSIGATGASMSYSAKLGKAGSFEFDELPVALTTDVLSDNCAALDAICAVAYGFELMPSQYGATWANAGHQPWPGPLAVYRRDPAIPSKALCRGACGPDCNRCKHPGEHRECVDDGGRHHWLVYPQLEDCATHDACKEHDACYDWCAAGMAGIEGFACHRFCDLECACNNAPAKCIGWIFGAGGSGRMRFSDQPYTVPGCDGPCPDATVDPASGTPVYRLCMPTVALTDPHTVSWTHTETTGDVILFSTSVPVPVLNAILLTITGRGDLNLSASASLGSITLQNVCLDVNPAVPTYTGSAELHVPATLEGIVELVGTLTAGASVLCLISLLSAEGGLRARGRATNLTELVARVDVVCNEGRLDLVASASLHNALQLGFDLDAFIRAFIFDWLVYSNQWNLVSARWDHSWDWTLGVLGRRAGGTGSIAPTLEAGSLPAEEMLRFLVTDASPAPLTTLSTASASTPAGAAAPTGSTPPTSDATLGLTSACGVKQTDGCGSEAMPHSKATFTGSTRGEKMVAEPLTKCPGDLVGSSPDPAIFGDVWEKCIVPNCETALWVRAHLLHGPTKRNPSRHLHGPGSIAGNLILGDQSYNQSMYWGIERQLSNLVHPPQNQVLWYEVDVSHVGTGHEQYFAKEAKVKWGYWDTVDKKHKDERSAGPFTPNHSPPACPGYPNTPNPQQDCKKVKKD